MPSSHFRSVEGTRGFLAALTAALTVSALILPGMAKDAPTWEPMHVTANWEAGEIEEAFYYGESKEVDRELINHASVWTLQEVHLAENARAYMGVGGAYFFVYPRNLGANPYSHTKRSGFGLTDAHGEFDFFVREEDRHGLRIKAGIFPFKYNPDAKNLGEYMFRTWTYPTIITTGGLSLVNSAAAQLSGVDANTKLGGFANDLMVTVQTERAPVLSLSLTDIASYTMGAFTVGAGIMFDNFYNPDPKAATPKGALGNQFYTLSDGRQMAQREYADLLSQGLIPAGTTVSDTGYYTLIGQKAMARAVLDFGKLIGSQALSDQDLRLYFEAIVLGLKKYPTFYEKTLDRTAFMFGLNLPTFRIVDLLSVEAEYCSNPYANSTRGPYGEGIAAPFVEAPPIDQYPNVKPVNDDDWKWTIYLRKQVYPGFAIHVQVANDHMKMLDVYSTPDFYDFLNKKNHWYWVCNLAYSI